MVNYPNGKKKTTTLKQNNSINRGMKLEDDLNRTNEYYLNHNIAIIHKKPTPIQVVEVNYPKRSYAMITKAFYRTPSTTDYNGVYKGKYLDFEAKETNSKTSFPLSNIHQHQIIHLENVIEHHGSAFLIIRFNYYNETYFVLAYDIIAMYKSNQKSIPYRWFQENCDKMPFSLTPPVDYLKVFDKYFKE